MIARRITAHKKQLRMTEDQILKLKKHLSDLIAGSSQFKKEQSEFMTMIDDQRAENWLTEEQIANRASV